MAINLYFIRHGKTRYNVRNLFTGWLDSSLHPDHIKDIIDIRKEILKRNIQFDIIITSDLKRSIDTAKIAYPFFKDALHIKEPLIRERDYGLLSGKSKIRLKKVSPKLYEVYHRSYLVPPPGGESFIMVEQRARRFLQKLFLEKYHHKHILISAHGNSLRVIFKILENLTEKEAEKIEIKFGKIYEYRISLEGGIISVEVVNGIKYKNKKISQIKI